jgi:hypothetical protein
MILEGGNGENASALYAAALATEVEYGIHMAGVNAQVSILIVTQL